MAATDILTTAEARSAINVSVSTLDTELALHVSGISQRIDALCGPVVARTVTTERHDGGKSFVILRYTPVLSITSVTEYVDGVASTLTAETLTSRVTNNYLLDTADKFSARIYRRESGADSTFSSGRLNIAVTYSAGRVADTASVTEIFKLAATAILRRTWKREQSAWAQRPGVFMEEDTTGADGFYRAVDPLVREFLAAELLPPTVI